MQKTQRSMIFLFTLVQKKFYGLVGANVAGKSTLIKSCCGLIAFDRGEIRIAGKSFVAGLLVACAIVNSQLYDSIDNQWLFAMPILVNYILISRVSVVIIMAYIIDALMLIPAVAVTVMYSGGAPCKGRAGQQVELLPDKEWPTIRSESWAVCGNVHC